jgi:trans-aconitate 2-methyltransferase
MDWDASTYDRIADPMFRWGSEVLGRLSLEGRETVLDAGCGSGRVTELLAQRVPDGRVIALDASPAMIDESRTRLARFRERISYVVANLGRPLPLDQPVDAVLSTATFHWVTDHDALFANLSSVMRPNARLQAQCGGVGNIERVKAAAMAAGAVWPEDHYFATPSETQRRLARNGFVDVRCWLQEAPTRLEPGEQLDTYMRTIILRTIVDRMSEPERDPFLRAVGRELSEPVIDYVRLNISARRAS